MTFSHRHLLVVVTSLLISYETSADNCVILLHGLARTSASMSVIESTLGEAGFKTVNHDYPSTRYPIDELSESQLPLAIGRCSPDDRVHFVTHSLGGILVRYYLENHELESLGRVVMLGPPNKGSHVVDVLRDYPGYELINGPAGMQLGTEATSIPNALGPAKFELGIIAGSRSVNLILSNLLANPDDGKVSVASTKLDGMSDHIVLPVTHTFMMRDDEVIAQIVRFLQSGEFDHSKAAETTIDKKTKQTLDAGSRLETSRQGLVSSGWRKISQIRRTGLFVLSVKDSRACPSVADRRKT